METNRTKEQVANWLISAQKRQQEWQQEVKQRWAARQPATVYSYVGSSSLLSQTALQYARPVQL